MAVERDTSSQWLRGVLDVCLLAVAEVDPAYGYEMTARLRERGLLTVAEGSIYPALGRLEREGLLGSYRVPGEGGPPRKYYKITAAGRALLQEQRTQWKTFSLAVTQVLRPPKGST